VVFEAYCLLVRGQRFEKPSLRRLAEKPRRTSASGAVAVESAEGVCAGAEKCDFE